VQRLLEDRGTKSAGGILEGRILHDLVENGRVTDVKMQLFRVRIDSRPADQPFEHAAVKPDSASFLQA
jgi:hypothetical protein